MIENGLRDRLIGFAPLAALIGNRVYPVILPQASALPAVVYSRVDTVREYYHGGQDGLARPRIQLSCWGQTYDAVTPVAKQVRLAVTGFRGSMASASGAYHVGAVFVVDERADFDQESKLYRHLIDIIVMYGEEVPA